MIAIAAASLFASACSKKTDSKSAPAETQAAEKTAKIHCDGANECKGHGSCKSAQNDCAGKNGCKGKGFVVTASADECKTKGGSVTEVKM